MKLIKIILIDILDGKYDFNELVNKINSLLKRNKNFLMQNWNMINKVVLNIKKAYSIDFSKNNTLTNSLGFSKKVLSGGQ